MVLFLSSRELIAREPYESVRIIRGARAMRASCRHLKFEGSHKVFLFMLSGEANHTEYNEDVIAIVTKCSATLST